MLKQFTLTAIITASLLVYSLAAPDEGSVGTVERGTPTAPSSHSNVGSSVGHANPTAPAVARGNNTAPVNNGSRTSPMITPRTSFQGPTQPGQRTGQNPQQSIPPIRMRPRPPTRLPHNPGLNPYPITVPGYPPVYSYYWYPTPLPSYFYYDYSGYYDYPYYTSPTNYYPDYGNGYNGYYAQGYYDGNYNGNDGSAVQSQTPADVPNQDNSVTNTQDLKKLQKQSDAWIVGQMGLQGEQKTKFLAHLRKLQSMRKIFMMTRQTLTEELIELQKDNASQEELTAKVQEIEDLDTKFQVDEKAVLTNLMTGLTVSQKAKYYSLQSRDASAQN